VSKMFFEVFSVATLTLASLAQTKDLSLPDITMPSRVPEPRPSQTATSRPGFAIRAYFTEATWTYQISIRQVCRTKIR
jgi:hypothetical protein